MWYADVNKDLKSTSAKECHGSLFGNITDPHARVILVYLMFILVPLCLYTFRALDDNRLVSWYWSIPQSQLLLLIGGLSISLLAVAFLARVNLPEQKQILSVSLIALVAPVLFWNGPETIIDSARYFSQAKFLELYGIAYFFREWGDSIFAWTDLPLVPFIYGLVFSVVGEQRAAIQFVGSLFLSGTVVITWLLGKNLWSHQHGIFGAVLLLGIPYLYTQTPLMMTDIPAMFFLSLALLVTVIAMKGRSRASLYLAGIAIFVAMMSKFSVWLLLSIVPLALLLVKNKAGDGKKVLAQRLAIITAVSLGCIAIFVVWKFDVVWQQLSMLFTFQLDGLGRWQESNVSSFLFHIYPLLTALAVFSVVVAVKKRDSRFLVIICMPLLLFLLDIKRMRYLIPVLPMIALMAAYGLAELNSSYLKRFIAYGIACSAFVIAIVLNNGFLKNTSADNIKSAGEFIDRMNYEAVEVVVLDQHKSLVNPVISIPQLDYFISKNVVLKSQVSSGLQVKVPNQVSKSSVRFTWDYKLPRYYTGQEESAEYERPLVIIYSDRSQLDFDKHIKKLKNYRLVGRFQKSTDVFKYRTMINIYEPV